MNPFKTKEFETLNKLWKKKLEKSGFKDIEQDEDNLKLWYSEYYKTRYTTTTFQAKEEYYRLASQFLHSNKFKNKKEEVIWTLYSEGLSIRNIVKVLKSRNFKAYKNEVNKIVRTLSKIMLEECLIKKT